MKGNKKGISSILGALIFLQILLISLLLVIHVIDNETNLTQKSIQKFQALSENAPVEEMAENTVTYLYSTTPFVITHVIYPNGEIVNASIVVNNRYPISQILNGYPWAIIVTSKGTWYNVSLLGGQGNASLITFPNYHDYGMPVNSSVLNVTQFPNWNVLEGIGAPSALSLVPVNVTVGDPTTYNWALTDAELVFYPKSSDGWINITYYQPIHYSFLYFDGYGVSINGGPMQRVCYSIYNLINATLGIYVPINITSTFIYNVSLGENHVVLTKDLSTLEYSYIYATDNQEVTTYPGTGGKIVSSTFYPQVGSDELSVIAGADKPFITLDSILFGNDFSPPVYFFPSYGISDSFLSLMFHNSPYYGGYESPQLPANALNLPPVNFYPTDTWNNIPYALSSHPFLPPQYETLYPLNITVYQVDINLNRGEVLNYGYYSYNNSWLLLFNWTFKYNNPEMYSEAQKITWGLTEPEVYGVPNGHGGFTFEASLPPWYNGQYYIAYVCPTNIDNIQYLTGQPMYIVVPQGVYLLQVSLS